MNSKQIFLFKVQRVETVQKMLIKQNLNPTTCQSLTIGKSTFDKYILKHICL